MVSVLLILATTIPIVNTDIAAENVDTAAAKLFKLELLSNISESELQAPLNRIIGLTMLLKSIGYNDSDAEKSVRSHAFNDFIGDYTWGMGWANIGVTMHITAGTSDSTYSPGKFMTKKEFITGQLRVLG
ncbi:hypothetical protein H7X64_03885, partial [Armatimonadetes bacterium]|nr:hypothetical protein [bacterium]